MITNNREYKQSKKQVSDLERALSEANDANTDPEQHTLMEAGAVALLNQLQDEINAYESLRDSERQSFRVNFGELGAALILARNLRKMSQGELAEKLGIKQQQIQRYEANEYEQASYARLKEVVWALDIEIVGSAQIGDTNAQHLLPNHSPHMGYVAMK